VVARIEVSGPGTRDVIALDGAQLSVGSAEPADLVLASDSAVSRAHLILVQVAGVWTVRDWGSANGTFVNKERLIGERSLRDGDEIRLGRSRLVFREPGRHGLRRTDVLNPAPELTSRQRDVLVELCRPLGGGGAFTSPATVAEIASALVVGQAAVKQHLVRLYDKFGIAEGTADRRVQLANAAIERGAVTIADLRRTNS
jgi:hypothetical protein